MTKAQLAKLHSVLTKVNKGAMKIEKRLEGIEVSQKIMGNVINELDKDIRNLFHVVQETQNQQRSSKPSLSLVAADEKTKVPSRPTRRDR